MLACLWSARRAAGRDARDPRGMVPQLGCTPGISIPLVGEWQTGTCCTGVPSKGTSSSAGPWQVKFSWARSLSGRLQPVARTLGRLSLSRDKGLVHPYRSEKMRPCKKSCQMELTFCKRGLHPSPLSRISGSSLPVIALNWHQGASHVPLVRNGRTWSKTRSCFRSQTHANG